jgi:hypothetical protein
LIAGNSSPIPASPPPVAARSDAGHAAASPPAQRRAWIVAALFVVAIVVCIAAYLAVATPGRFVSSAQDRRFDASALSLPRGTATTDRDGLLITAAAPDGNTVVSVVTDLRAADYPVIAWKATDIPAGVVTALLWRTDVEPTRLNTRELGTESGRIAEVDMHRDPHWIGRVTGLALALRGPLPQPVRVHGVVAKPADAAETLRDRVGEWFAPAFWTGSSINTVTGGGADDQALPLPLLLATAIVLAAGALLALDRVRRGTSRTTAIAVAALVLGAWFALDARWGVNLARQVGETARQYAGKDAHERHLAAADGALFAFVEKVRAILPAPPARVFVVSDTNYFRGRAAYHLYPHNVWYEPYRNDLPPIERLQSGDWLFVYQRRGIDYNATLHRLRFDGGKTIGADLKLLEHGAALFLVQ